MKIGFTGPINKYLSSNLLLLTRVPFQIQRNRELDKELSISSPLSLSSSQSSSLNLFNLNQLFQLISQERFWK